MPKLPKRKVDELIEIERGIEKGELNKVREMAEELIRDNVDMKLIARYTKLTIEEIKEIRKSIIN